jgi:Transposase IS4
VARAATLSYDNYFTCPELQLYLEKNGIYTVGTVRSKRIPQCALKSEADLQKLCRGLVDEKVATVDGIKISSVRWLDNKDVALLSTFAESTPVSEVTHWDRKTTSYKKVSCPDIVSVYNKHMGSVVLMDSLK